MSDPTGAPAAPPDLVGQVIADRYRVERLLGEGGMGQVYVAKHVTLPREVAIKILHRALAHDPDSVARFQREASNASRINSPHAATVYDFGELPNKALYIAMEFVPGRSLSGLLDENRALPADRAVRIIEHVAAGLDVAHGLGIIHRDLKPDNILITTGPDGKELAKVVDFGISTAFSGENQRVTRTGMIAGTLEYMSPEQVSASKCDQRSDVYSLALVAYVMLTGQNPFPGETAMMSMLRRLSDPPMPLAQSKGDVAWPAEMQAVFEKALEREPDDRYQSAGEFARALAQAAEKWRGGQAKTSVAEASTTIIGAQPKPSKPAPPKTQVSKSGGAPAATVVEPAVPSPVEKKGPPVALIGGGLAAVGAAAFVAMKMLGGPAAPAATADSARPPAPPPQATAPATPPPAVVETVKVAAPTPAPPQPERAVRPPAGPSAPTVPAATPARKGPTEDQIAAVRRLEALEEILNPGSSTPAQGRQALTRIEDVMPRLPTANDSARAFFYRAEAYAIIDDSDTRSICASLGEARRLASDATLKLNITNMRNVAECP
ncbi:MAG: serine/threonine-protein kinase [Gemmatimonadales bacterium]|nr:serine/threonine-protein kinase [Gemmatimonadales bacterium]